MHVSSLKRYFPHRFPFNIQFILKPERNTYGVIGVWLGLNFKELITCMVLI